MEAFTLLTAPTLLALLAGIAFLYRFWPYTSTSTSKLVNLGKYETLDTITDVTEEENRGVSKESNFPAGWWVSKDIFELEKRAIFSKVSYIYHWTTVLKDALSNLTSRHGCVSPIGVALRRLVTISPTRWLGFPSF